jgi:hypothetical protein
MAENLWGETLEEDLACLASLRRHLVGAEKFQLWRVAVRAKTRDEAIRCVGAAVVQSYEDGDWAYGAFLSIDEDEAPLHPYLLFLNRLFAHLGAERIDGMKKGELENEIRRRWPADQFGPPSRNLITPMATILRSLEAKRGGAKQKRRQPSPS